MSLQNIENIIHDLDNTKCSRKQMDKAIAVIQVLDAKVKKLSSDLNEANNKISWMNFDGRDMGA